jgi:DNA replication protein DnaC
MRANVALRHRLISPTSAGFLSKAWLIGASCHPVNNRLLFGPPGGGKSHLASAIGLALIENGWKVLFTRTTDLVQKLQVARRELDLEAAINRLDRFHL